MTDLASLGIEVDTRQLQDGAKAMDAMGEASARLDQKVGSLNGQMNDTSEIMRRSAAAADMASEATKRILDPLRQEIDLFGASRGEIERYRASKAGLSAAAQREAQALGDAIAAMQRDEAAAREVAKAQDDAARAADAFMKKLNDQVATLGMNTQQLQAYRAAQLGVSDAAAPLIARLGEAGSAARGAGGHLEGLSFASANAKREVLVLAHELSQGNFSRFGSSMMVLGEQTGAASLLFSGAGLAALGLAAAVGGVAYAMVKGAAEQKHMNDALIMTGNYAGETADSLTALSHAAVATGGSIAEAKKVATELAASGKFTGDQIGYITEATVAWEHATGKSVQATIKEFESLAVQSQGSSMRATESISKATLKLDDTYHFLTESVYEQIRALEKEGDAKGASALATAEFAKVTHDRSEEILANLGSIARGWNTIKEVIGGATDGLKEFGAKVTAGSEVNRIGLKLKYFDEGVANSNARLGRPADELSASLAATRTKIELELTDAVIKKNKADADANAESAKRVAESEANHAASRIMQDDAKLEKRGMTELQIALRGYGEDLAKLAAVNKDSPLLRQDAVDEHMAALVKAHSPKASTRGQDDRTKVLADALGNERAALEGEKSVYDAREKMLTLYHQKFATSDAEYYAGREGARADYIAAEAITYAKEQALVKASLDAARNPQEVAAAKGKYDQLVAAHQKFADDMRNARGADAASAEGDEEKRYQDTIKAIQAAGTAESKRLDDAIAKQREHNAEIGKSKDQIDLARAAAQDLATTQLQSDAEFIRDAIAKEGFDDKALAVYQIRLADLDSEIAKRSLLSKMLADAAVLDADAKAAKAASDAWNSTAAHVKTTLADAIANGGANAWKKLKTAIVGQALSVPINFVGNAAASILNPTAAQSASNAMGMVNGASSAFSLASGSALAGVGNGISSIGSYFGSTAVADFGAGLSGTASAEAMAAALAGDVAAPLSAAASAGASLASAFSVALPWVAAAGAAYMVWKNFFEDGPEQNTHLTFGSNNAAGNISINERGNEGKNSAYIDNYGKSSLGTFGVTNSFWMSSDSDVVQSFIKTVSQTDDALAAFLTTTEKASVSSYLTGKTATAQTGAEGSNPNAGGALDKVFADRINNILTGVEPGLAALVSGFSGTSQALATEAAALLSYRAALKDSGEAVFGAKVTLQDLAALKAPTEATSVALTRITSEFQATNQVVSMLGVDSAKGFGAVGLASEAARSQVILLSGGLSSFSSQASDYAQNFLSDAQRMAPVAKQLDAALGSLGLSTIPTTKVQFAALVDQLVSSGALATEQGAKQFAGLMAVESAFAQVHAQEAAAVRSAADIASERADLQKQLDEATLTSAQLLTKQRDALDASNRALFDQVQAAHAAADAQAAAAQATADAIAKAQASAAAATQSFGNALASSMDAALNAAKAFRALNDALLIGGSSTLSPEQKYAEAKRQFETAGGDKLADAEKAFLDASKAWFGGSAGYAADFNAVLARNSKEAADQEAYAASIPEFWKEWQRQTATIYGVNGSHANGLDFVPFDGYRAELHRGERVQTAAAVRDGDAAAQETNELLRELIDKLDASLGADKTQRGAVGTAVLEKLDMVADKLDANKRAVRAAK